MMRRTPLKRGKPLRRTGRLRAKSKTNSYARRDRDLDHMAKVRRLPCMVRTWAKLVWRLTNNLVITDPESHELRMVLYARHVLTAMPITVCSGRVQVDHVGERAYGKKCPDNETAPMCRHHHGERTDYVGTFKNFNAAEMRAWCDWAIRVTYHELEDMDDCHTVALDLSSL